MNWKDYEKEVHDYFAQMYPNSTITYDAKIIGRYSKKERQLDVLIEDNIAGFPLKVVIDAKYFSRNIDVKCVESFISMLEDVNANQGLLVTQKGYSEAAINRAYYGPQELELDVLNFDDLLNHQGLEAIPYAGEHGLILSSPFGWVIDNKKHSSFISCLYQRGLNLEEAQNRKEWIYFNFWKKDKHVSNIKELVSMQNAQMGSLYTNLCINEIRSPVRKDGRDTYIRIAKYNELPCNELTGYIDSEEFIVFFVLFTPEELQGRNVRKLNHLLQYSNPIKVKFNNTVVIDKLKVELLDIAIPVKRASAYNQLANWYSEMDNECEAMSYRRFCWDADPEYYENITPLILGELKFNNIESAINYSVEFFSFNPENPRVMQDLLSIFEEEKYRGDFEQLIKRLKAKYEGENEVLGNVLFHYAIYLYNSEKKNESIEHFKLSRDFFFRVDENHDAIQQINDTLIENNITS
jgi:hypothetical protein